MSQELEAGPAGDGVSEGARELREVRRRAEGKSPTGTTVTWSWSPLHNPRGRLRHWAISGEQAVAQPLQENTEKTPKNAELGDTQAADTWLPLFFLVVVIKVLKWDQWTDWFTVRMKYKNEHINSCGKAWLTVRRYSPVSGRFLRSSPPGLPWGHHQLLPTCPNAGVLPLTQKPAPGNLFKSNDPASDTSFMHQDVLPNSKSWEERSHPTWRYGWINYVYPTDKLLFNKTII